VAEKSEDAATGLIKWLSNGEEEELKGSQSEILDELIPELVKLDKKGLDGIGKALAAKGIGDSFENGLKLLKTYFVTANSKQYGKSVANAFVEAVSKNPNLFKDFVRVIEDEYPVYFGRSPDTYDVPTPEDQSKIQGKLVYIYILDPNTKDIVAEGTRKVKQLTSEDMNPQKTFTFPESNIKGGEEYLILIKEFIIGDFYNKYNVKDKIVMEGGNAYYMDPNGRALKQLGPGKLDGTKDKVWIDFPFKDLREVTDPKEAPELKLRVSSTGATYIIYPSRNPDLIESALIKSVRDESGNIVAELLYARAPRGELLDKYLLSRNLPHGYKWCLSNDEGIVELKSSKTLAIANDFIKRIFDPQTYEKLEEGLSTDTARIAAIFETPEGKKTMWTKTSKIEFIVPEKATEVSKFYIIWAEDFEETFDSTSFKTSIVRNQEGKLEKHVIISGPEGTLFSKTDYRFTSPYEGKVALLLDLPYSKYKPAFEFGCDNAGNLVVKTVLKYIPEGTVEASYEVEKYEYQKTYYTTKGDQLDDVLIAYMKNEVPKIIGLSHYLSSDIDYRPGHAVAAMHMEDYIINRMEGKIKGYEVTDPQVGRRIDIIAEIKNEKAIMEAKEGMERTLDENTVKQPEKDIELLIGKGKEKYGKAYYFFDKEPSGEGARKYLKIIREVYVKHPEVAGKVFVIIGENGSPVAPTDPSLDPYINK